MAMLLAALLAAGAAPLPAAAPIHAPSSAATPVAQAKPAPAQPDREQVLAAVKTEWAHYDQGNKGKLTPLEFGTWVMRSHGASVAPAGKAKAAGIKPVAAMNASATAFARADANHDGGVTPEEMVNFLIAPSARPASAVQLVTQPVARIPVAAELSTGS